jgi:hypothetical protein
LETLTICPVLGFLSRINSKFFKKKKSALLHILSNVPHNNVYIYINWVTLALLQMNLISTVLKNI